MNKENFLYMAQGPPGPVLTEKRKDVIRGEYDGTPQAKYDHVKEVIPNIKGGISDLAWLAQHVDHFERPYAFELREIFGEGSDPPDGPVPYLEHRDPIGFVATETVNEQGRPVPPEYNPDAPSKVEYLINQIEEPNKASPETQEGLINAVAFICQAAEAGELNVDWLIECAVERYYQNSPTKDGQIIGLKKWDETTTGGILKNEFERGDFDRDTTSVPTSAVIRYLEREGYDPLGD